MAGWRPPYAAEFKAEAVRLVRESGKSVRQVAQDLGVSCDTLAGWLRQHEIDTGQRDGLTTSEREELTRLRREVRVLQEEREIFKKAAAFFAQ